MKAPAPLSERVLGLAAMALLIAALILGGATREGDLANGVLRLASLPVLLLALWRISRLPLSSSARQGLVLLAAVAAVPLLQLVPLPPALWGALPGRAQFVETYRLAGMAAPWAPLSLNPEGTWNAGLSLLPAGALFVSVLALDGSARRRLAAATLAVVLASVVLGVMQVQGSASRFYEITNPSSAVGFFANRNHQASLMLVAIPLAAQWMVSRARRAGRLRPLIFPVGAGLVLVALVGLLASDTRAGLALAAPALAAFMLIFLRVDPRRVSPRVWLAVIGGAAVLVALLAALAASQQLGALVSDEMRLRFAPIVFRAGLDFMPAGSGLGTFESIFGMYEPAGLLGSAFLNHAHNDYLEIWLETGLAGLLLMAVFMAWFAVRAHDAWMKGRPGSELGRAASAVVALLLIHSLVDYPLRTSALATLFAFACGCLVPPANSVARYFETQTKRPEPRASRETSPSRRPQARPVR